MPYPVGHSLVGLTIAKKTKIHPFFAMVLAVLADIDYLYGFVAQGNFLIFHLGATYVHIVFAISLGFLFLIATRLLKLSLSRIQLLGFFFFTYNIWIHDINKSAVHAANFFNNRFYISAKISIIKFSCCAIWTLISASNTRHYSIYWKDSFLVCSLALRQRI